MSTDSVAGVFIQPAAPPAPRPAADFTRQIIEAGAAAASEANKGSALDIKV